MEGVVVITLLCSVEGDTTSDGETRKLEELRQSVSIATVARGRILPRHIAAAIEERHVESSR